MKWLRSLFGRSEIISRQISPTAAITITDGEVTAVHLVDRPMFWDGNNWSAYSPDDKISISEDAQ